MQLEYTKATFIAVWVLAVCAAGAAAGVSPSGWTVLAGFAVLAPLVVPRYWNDSRQSMSESIREVLR